MSTDVRLKEATITPKHSSGFAARLTRVLQQAQVKEYGRLSLLARETELTPGGARLMFSEDRPPKQLAAYLRLLDALCRLLADADIDVDSSALSAYLLDGSEDPLNLESTEDVEAILGQIDAVYVAKIYVLIDKLASQSHIDLYKDIETDTLRELYNRVLRYCIAQDMDAESEDLKDIIISSFKLAKANLL
jgi:hypothetical protein